MSVARDILKHMFFRGTRVWQCCVHVTYLVFIVAFISTLSVAFASDLIITGVIDGPRAGGRPKAIELYVINDIADLSEYGVESANNGAAAAGAEYTFPNNTVSAGTYLYLAIETAEFTNFFGFAPDYVNILAPNINGNDAVVLYRSGVIVDVFGVVGIDGSGEPWEYEDGWAYRNNRTSPSATFNVTDWTFSGVDALNGATDNATAVTAFPTGQWTASAVATRPIINPDPDVQVRNGATLAAQVITSNALKPYTYGTVKRGQSVVLEYLLRNTGKEVLELGDLTLPPFLNLVSEPLPETLASFASAPLSLQVDTRTPGQLSGEVILTSNDPDAFENPFTFTVKLNVSNTPANALYVLPGVSLPDREVQSGTSVPVLSLQLRVPAGSDSVSLDALTLNADSVPALARATRLQLYIDGGTRGEKDWLDVPLATWLPPAELTESVTFDFPVRTLEPDLPLWLLIVADF